MVFNYLKSRSADNMKLKESLIALCCIIAVAIFYWLDLQRVLTLEALQANRQALLGYYAAHQTAMVIGFVTVYIVQTALSLPGAAVLSLAGGAVFGTVMGTIYVIIAATIGATMSFLLARSLLRDVVLKRFGSKLDLINKELESRGFSYLFFLRLVPVFPFFLINMASGLTRLSLRTFITATIIGIIPGGLIFVNAGASLATIHSVSEIMSMRVLGSLSLLGLLVLLPTLYGKFTKRG